MWDDWAHDSSGDDADDMLGGGADLEEDFGLGVALEEELLGQERDKAEDVLSETEALLAKPVELESEDEPVVTVFPRRSLRSPPLRRRLPPRPRPRPRPRRPRIRHSQNQRRDSAVPPAQPRKKMGSPFASGARNATPASANRLTWSVVPGCASGAVR